MLRRFTVFVVRSETKLQILMPTHPGKSVIVFVRRMLNRLFDGFEGNLTSSKWAKMCKVSQDTASREINVLVSMGVLVQQGQGRATHYVMEMPQLYSFPIEF